MFASVCFLTFSAEGEKSKFDELYQLYKKQVYFIALKYLDDSGKAEDVVQITFFKVFCNIDKFTDLAGYRIKGYLFAIAKNAAMDVLRKEKTNLCVTGDEEISSLDIVSECNTENEILKKEKKEYVNSKLDQMSDTDKKLLTLKYISEKSDKEIAEELGISYENVRVKLMRAKKKMAKSILEEKEDIFDEF